MRKDLELERVFCLMLIGLMLTCCKNQTKPESTFSVSKDIYLRDTLTLQGLFSECGEWGGHHETFKIFSRDNKLGFKYTKDTVKCYNPQLFNRRIIKQKDGIVSNKNWIYIEEYISRLLRMSFVKEGSSNSANAYTVEQKGFDYRLDSIPRLNIRYSNYKKDWTGFEELKEKLLFKPNN